MRRIMLCVLASVFLLAACESTTRGIQQDTQANFGTSSAVTPNATEEEIWVGVVAVRQSLSADSIVDQSSPGEERFFALYHALQDNVVQGVSGDTMTLFLGENGSPVSGSERSVLVRNGVAKATMPRSLIKRHMALCVRVPDHWGYIARQERYPAGSRQTMCSDTFGRIVSAGNARTRGDAHGVYVIKPASARRG